MPIRPEGELTPEQEAQWQEAVIQWIKENPRFAR
jgi:hypothetical protein